MNIFKTIFIATFVGLAAGFIGAATVRAEECVTPEFAKEYVMTNNPSVEVVFELIKEGDGVIAYASPDRDGNLVQRFVDGCQVGSEVVPFIPGV